MIKHINKQEGLGLVELLIVLVLLNLVLSVGYMFFSFGVEVYNRGEKKAIAQQAARLTSDFITAEVRYGKDITVNPDNGINDLDFHYIFLENNSIKYRSINYPATPDRILADSQADKMNFTIEFSAETDYDLIIFKITADQDFYELETKVHALNMSLDRSSDLEVQTGDISIIRYKKPTD